MESVARILTLMLFAALILTLATHGWGGVSQWLHAKFIGTGK